MEKTGSMPPEAPAMMEIVPVGAMVVAAALRIGTRVPRSLQRFRQLSAKYAWSISAVVKSEPWKFGNSPRFSASSMDISQAVLRTKLMVRSARPTAASESYGTPRR